MEFDNSFEVPLPPAEAWPVLMDIRGIAPCMPGAQLTEVVDDRTYKGNIAVRLGPVALTFAGTVKFEEIDNANHTARVRAQGTDAKGRGSAQAPATFRLEPAASGSKVLVHTDLTLSGAVAQYGRGVGMIQATASALMNQFATALKAQLASAAPHRRRHARARSAPATPVHRRRPRPLHWLPPRPPYRQPPQHRPAAACGQADLRLLADGAGALERHRRLVPEALAAMTASTDTDPVILVDADDVAVGTADKLDAHRRGLRHRAISALVRNADGEFLLQRRTRPNTIPAGLWTNACCSHPLPGESVADAAHRRLAQEMGVACALEPLFVLPVPRAGVRRPDRERGRARVRRPATTDRSSPTRPRSANGSGSPSTTLDADIARAAGCLHGLVPPVSSTATAT